jgi:putative ABC transport system permease protein
MLNLTIKNIFHKKARSILTIMGIVIAMQLYIVLSGIMNAYDKDMQKQVSSMAGKVFVQANNGGTNSMLPIQSFISESDSNKLLLLDGIDRERSTKILYNEVLPSPAPNTPPSVMIVGIEPSKENVYYGNIKVNGKSSNIYDNSIILGASAADWAKREYNVTLNEKITLKGEKFKIVGILPSINTMVDGSIIMPIKTAQDLYSKNNLVNSIIITATKTDEVEKLASTINKYNNKVSASTSKEIQKTADEMLTGQRAFFAMINNTIVFVAIFMVMIIMIMAIHERKKEIGTLKAMGASYKDILVMVISESTIFGIVGGIIALPASVLFTWVIFGATKTDIATIFTYNNPKDWPMIIVVTLLIGIISGIIPAISARKVNPLESIRYE